MQKIEDGNAFYPKDKTGEEIVYGDYIYYKDGSFKYPLNRDGMPKHETDDNHQYEIDTPKQETGRKIYPIQVTHQTARRYKEVILNEKYATTDLQEAKYPLDEYGNEYTLEIPIQLAGKEKIYFPRGYPITNDNWVIVPEVDGKELISDQLLPKVQATNIIGKLYREGKNYRDYVTNVKSTHLSRAARQKYNIFPNVLGASNPPPLNNLEGKRYYAKDKDKKEIYPIVNNKVQTIPFLYAKDASGNDTYPTDLHGNEFPIPEKGTGGFMYATDKDGNAFYPTDNTGKEMTYGKYIYKKDGFIQYPLNREGHPEYQTDDTTNDEVYVFQMDGSINWGVDKEGNQRYAKKENGDEYYPANGEFACDHSVSPQYARTSDGEVIFPLDAEGNESYLKEDEESHVIYMGDVLLDLYAKTKNGEEIYPIQVINPTRFKEVI
ncbi:uncharacterized protein TNCT_341121 [Trichonephila clavata]|uniref:Uncharacterized protein n=1 Tax=Trichonephila clavata TaxID=2740835 RepID=A0A8X6HTR7_TRICU|nr:uncharacterized protein TNCT_341121 [Trichonephila clavata]